MKKRTGAVAPVSAARTVKYNAAKEKEDNVIGLRIAEARRRKGLTLAAFCESLKGCGVKITPGGAGKWETGYSIPNAYQLIAICSALEIEDQIPFFMSDYVPALILDMDSKDVLKNALLQYTGTLIVVSHDRDFLQGLTDALFEFRDGAVHEFKGDIFEFLDYRRMEHLKELETAKKKQGSETVAQTVSQNKLNYQQAKERERELRRLRGAVERIEQEIGDLEQSIAEKEALLSAGSEQTVSDGSFYADYQALKDKLDERMAAWEEATVELENFQNS